VAGGQNCKSHIIRRLLQVGDHREHGNKLLLRYVLLCFATALLLSALRFFIGAASIDLVALGILVLFYLHARASRVCNIRIARKIATPIAPTAITTIANVISSFGS